MSNYENNGNENWYYNSGYYPQSSDQTPSEYDWSQCQVPPPYPNFSVPPPNYTDAMSGYTYPPPPSQVDYNYYNCTTSNNANIYPYYGVPQNVASYSTTSYSSTSYSSSTVYDYSQELESYKIEQNQEKPSEYKCQSTYTTKYNRKSVSEENKNTERR